MFRAMRLCRLITCVAAAIYAGICAVQVHSIFNPRACRGSRCFRPLLAAGARVDLRAYVVWPAADGADGAEWRTPVWNASNASLAGGSMEASFDLPIPRAVRRGLQRQLALVVELRVAGNPALLTTARTELVGARVPPVRGEAEYLLDPLLRPAAEKAPRTGEGDGSGHAGETECGLMPLDGALYLDRTDLSSGCTDRSPYPADPPPGEPFSDGPVSSPGVLFADGPVSSPAAPEEGMATWSDGRVPHYLYAHRPADLRIVTDATPHESPHLPEGLPIGNGIDYRRGGYAPLFYFESFRLLRKHAAPLSADVGKKDPRLRVVLRPVSMGRHRVMAGIVAPLQVRLGWG